MATLYNVDSPITREQRNNLNATLRDIQSRFSAVNLQLSFLNGGQDLEQFTQRLQQILDNAEGQRTQWMQFNFSGNQAVPDNTQYQPQCNQIFPFNGANFASLDSSGNIVVSQKGLYTVYVYILFEQNNVGYRSLFVTHTTDAKNAINGTLTPVATSALVEMEANTPLEFTVLQTSGGNLNITNLVIRITKNADIA